MAEKKEMAKSRGCSAVGLVDAARGAAVGVHLGLSDGEWVLVGVAAAFN